MTTQPSSQNPLPTPGKLYYLKRCWKECDNISSEAGSRAQLNSVERATDKETGYIVWPRSPWGDIEFSYNDPVMVLSVVEFDNLPDYITSETGYAIKLLTTEGLVGWWFCITDTFYTHFRFIPAP